MANAALGMVAVPESASWALLILGFGVVGVAARRQRATAD
ncbi:MAG: PEPxxWA-CTERM sorting domain-containing protein [Sandaracinobacter sp.]